MDYLHKQLFDALESMDKMHKMMMAKVNHRASFYDAECLDAMNNAPILAAQAMAAYRQAFPPVVPNMTVTGDHRILRALCEELGYLPPIPRVTCEVSDLALLETYTRLISELGEFSQAFHTALEDGVLTHREVARLEQEMLDFFAAGEELLSRAKSIARG